MEKQYQIKYNLSQHQEIVNIRVEINDIKTKRRIQGLTNLTTIYLRR